MSLSTLTYLKDYQRPAAGSISIPATAQVLIVDDVPARLASYKEILEDLGQDLVTARSGEEALRLVLKHDFAVILLHVDMAGMDGFETADLIRGRRKSARVPIIFLTTAVNDVDAAQGYASGAVDYLHVPVVPEILRAKIHVFIELFRMRQQAELQAEERALRKSAEASARRKDEFLAILAHELRNPLAPLSNALHLLQFSGQKPEIVRKSHEIMSRQLQCMVRLVDDLMDVSRITRGKIHLRLENVSLKKSIDNALETVNPLIEAKRHRIDIDMPEEPIIVRADIVRLSQIFSNLLNNAAKYTDPGGVITLNVEVKNTDVLISIHDTGIGISKEKLPDVFKLFTQVDSSLSRAEGGLGIGLTVVKNLAEMQNGTVEVFSEGLGRGSMFTVKLPTVQQDDRISKKEEVPDHPDRQQSLKILIVDDSEDSAKTLGWMLEMLGHEITLAFNGPDCIELAKTLHPHVVLLDIGLPAMSGYEVCKIMRKNPDLKETVFIAQTGWGQESHKRRSAEAGFHHHLVKPIELKDLENILTSIDSLAAPQ